jgi:cell wall-associated NlpC family hydrolase
MGIKQISLLLIACLLLNACGNSRKITKEEEPSKAEAKKLRAKYAAMLGVDEDRIDNAKLYRFIDEWYGVPYKYGGKAKTGVDCSGFTCILYREAFGKQIQGSAAGLYEICKPVKKDDLEEGDLVFFKINGDRVSHVGVYLQNNKFVHASTKKGIIINDLDEAYYKKYYFKGGRPK